MARSRLSTGATGMSSHPSERSEEDFFQVSSSVPPALASQVPETMEAQPEAQPEAARPYLRRRSTLADVVAKNFTQATRTNMKRHLQAAVSVAFGRTTIRLAGSIAISYIIDLDKETS